MGNLRDIVRELIKDNEEIYSMVCKVSSVDEKLRTCDVVPVNGSAEVFDVRLQSKNDTGVGLVAFPAIDSDVTVSFITKDLAFVSCTNEIDRVQLNIGDMSLMIDAENFEKSVQNIKINTKEYDLTGENVTFTLSSMFLLDAQDIEILGANITMDAAFVDITGQTSINGITEVNGMTTINGLTNINGLTTINAGATISGAVAMASSLVIAGGVNGGVPVGSKIKDEINKVILEVNKLKTALKNWSPVNNDGGAALKAASSAFASNQLNNVSTSGISNDNVKH